MQLQLHEPTAAFMYLHLLPPRTWWRLRALSPAWRSMLDGSPEGGPGLLAALLEAAGPLQTANEEVTFAGCVYTAVHHRSAGPLRMLLERLAMGRWARTCFAQAVAREALVQAAVSGDAPCCRAVLEAHGPGSPADKARRGLGQADTKCALEAVVQWSACDPDDVTPEQRGEVDEILKAVC